MFTFEHESPSIHTTLQAIRTKIFSKVEMMEGVPLCNTRKAMMTFKKLLECYNVMKEEYEDEDPRNIQVPEIEGTCIVEGPELSSITYTQPITTKKVNIGTMKNPTFSQIGYYWNDEIIEKVVDLLWEYHDLFPTTFSKMKGIACELREMKIPLKPGAKPIR
jgi:hypothetical protein